MESLGHPLNYSFDSVCPSSISHAYKMHIKVESQAERRNSAIVHAETNEPLCIPGSSCVSFETRYAILRHALSSWKNMHAFLNLIIVFNHEYFISIVAQTKLCLVLKSVLFKYSCVYHFTFIYKFTILCVF